MLRIQGVGCMLGVCSDESGHAGFMARFRVLADSMLDFGLRGVWVCFEALGSKFEIRHR